MLNKKYTIGQYIIKMIRPKIFNIYLDTNLLLVIDDKFNDLDSILSTLLNIKPMFLDCHNDNSSIFLYVNPDIDDLINMKITYYYKHSYVICNLDKIGYTEDAKKNNNIINFINTQNLGIILGYPPIAVEDFMDVIYKPKYKNYKIEIDYFGINFVVYEQNYDKAMKFLKETYIIPNDFKTFCNMKRNYYNTLFNYNNNIAFEQKAMEL